MDTIRDHIAYHIATLLGTLLQQQPVNVQSPISTTFNYYNCVLDI